MDDGPSGQHKDVTADKHFKVVYTLVLCGRRRYVKGFSKMGA